MENSEEKSEYLYNEPIKGDVYRRKIDSVTDGYIFAEGLAIPNKVFPDGSYYLPDKGSFFPETEEWKIKYQNSLSLRVLQAEIPVYFVMSVKRGKVNTRALVLDGYGHPFHAFVPTFPAPRLGERFMRLRMDLEVISRDVEVVLFNKVVEARRADPSL